MTEEQHSAIKAYSTGEVNILRQSRHYIGMEPEWLQCWEFSGRYYVTETHAQGVQFLGDYASADDAIQHYYQRENHLITN